MKVLVTGAAGVVGRSWTAHAKDRYDLVGVDLAAAAGVSTADLRKIAQVAELMDSVKPDVVLHLAANKDVFFCEGHPDEAYATNVLTTRNLATVCAVKPIHFLFISSDYVFGAEDRIWRETDAPCPTTEYGRGKAESESWVRELLPTAAIVRTAGLYGFRGDLVEVVRSTLSDGKTFAAFANLINQPTWVGDFFAMLDAVIVNHLSGIFHAVGPESMSRYDYARWVADAGGFDSARIIAESLDFSLDVRPPSLRLDGTWTYRKLDCKPHTLAEYLRHVGT